MEIITMESSAYRNLMENIDKIMVYVRDNERNKEKEKTTADVWLNNQQVMAMLNISKRTLQRMRDDKRIEYAIIRGKCRYHLPEIERLVKNSIVKGNPERIEDFKRNYLLRTGGNPAQIQPAKK